MTRAHFPRRRGSRKQALITCCTCRPSSPPPAPQPAAGLLADPCQPSTVENGLPVFSPRSRQDRQRRPLPLRVALASGGCRFQTRTTAPSKRKWKRGPARGRCRLKVTQAVTSRAQGRKPRPEDRRQPRDTRNRGPGRRGPGIRPSAPPRLLQPARRLRPPRRGHHRGHSGVRHRGSLTPASGRSPIPRRPQLRVSGEQRPGTQLGTEKHVGHFREGSPAFSVIRKKTPTRRRWEAGYHRDGANAGA